MQVSPLAKPPVEAFPKTTDSALAVTQFQDMKFDQASPPADQVQVKWVNYQEELLPPPIHLLSPSLTLDEAINTTLLADPKIRAGLEAINQASADALTSSLRPNPQINLSHTLLPLTHPFTVDRTGGPPQFDAGVSFPIDWFLFGKQAAAMASAATGVQISEAEYADTVRQRVTETAVAFFDVLEAKALSELARQDLAALRRLEDATEKAVRDGGRPAVDLKRVLLDRLASEQALREADSTLSVAEARLRALLGRRDDDPDFDLAGNLDIPLSARPLPVQEALVLAEQNRPDIQALRLQIDKGARDVDVQVTNARAEITPAIGYTRQFQERAMGVPNANAWGFGFNLTLPIHNRNQGNIAKARSVLVQNSLLLEAALINLRADVIEVVQGFQTAYEIATSVADEQRRVATDVRASIEKAFQEGGRPLIDVLDARRNYLQTNRLYVTSRASYWRSLYRYNAAVGKQVLP